MSVAVISIQPSYMEPYIQSALSTLQSDTDSDAGYGTPAENLVCAAEENHQKLAASADGDSSSDGDVVEADSDLQEKIIKQVEWYFSDENLLKDSFLMKHINRNKQGYVSLKLVASLRKVKTLSKDWKAVLEGLKHSNLLALNEEKTKIRRVSPAPQVDFSHIAKTLLITEYPRQEPNPADLEQHFGRYGEVTRVRLIHPGRAIPLDVKPCKAQHSSLGKDLCILVEFESEQIAKLAQRKIREQQSWRDEMKVHLLGEKKPALVEQEANNFEDKSTQVRQSDGKKKSKGKDSKMPDAQSLSAKQKGTYGRDNSLATQRLIRDYSSPKNSREGIPTGQLVQRRASPSASSSPDTHTRHRKLKHSPELSRKHLRPESSKDYSSDSGLSSCGSRSSSESPKFTPEPTRKFFSAGGSSELSWRSVDKQHAQVNSCVIRQPLGPDGTRGFAKHHRLNPISIAVNSC